MKGFSHGPSAAPGQTVGPYTLLEALGAGGMAAVFRARDAAGHEVALKMLHPASLVAEEEKRFRREFDTLARLDHPNIVRVIEAGKEGPYPWIALELVEGTDLETVIARWAESPPPDRHVQVERIFRGLCAALAYLHRRRLIHRDLKPQNVLIRNDGVPKVTDFGVVKDPEATWTQLTMAGKLVGTVAFMAPEQISGEPLDPRADLYALGAILYMMLTGRRPIEATSVAGYLARHLTETPAPPSQIDPTVPPALEAACLRLLRKDPAQRHPSAQAVLDALDADEAAPVAPLRGREAELATWEARLGELAAGGGGAWAVVGPAGSGRSHLLRGMAELGRAHGLRVALVEARSGDPVRALAAALGADLASLTAAPMAPTLLLVDDLDASPETIPTFTALLRDGVGRRGQPLLLAFTALDAEGPASPLILGLQTGLPAELHALGPLERRDLILVLRDHHLAGAAAPTLGKRLHDDYGGQVGPALEQLRALIAAGWLTQQGDQLKPTRPLEALRVEPLPLPDAVRARLGDALDALDPDAREVIELLAVIGRSATPTLLARCVGGRDLSAAIREVSQTGLVRAAEEEGVEVLILTHPALAVLAKEALDTASIRKRHAAVANALLARRRRSDAQEVAEHLLAAGQTAEALPQLVAAARRCARNDEHLQVIQIARRVSDADLRSLPDPSEALRTGRWLAMLEGEARLCLGAWEEAVAPLERALAAARQEDDRGAVARCLAGLGRAWFRQGRFQTARPLLLESLALADAGAPERASANRALADMALQTGHIPEALARFEAALALAEDAGSRDGEARARRGLAHVRAVEGRMIEAADLLDQAEELLHPDGDPRVLASVRCRALEFDLAAGKWGAGLRRGQELLEFLRLHELAERAPEVHSLLAELHNALGDRPQALAQVRATLTGEGGPPWDARLRVARVLCAIGQPIEVEEALPRLEELPEQPIDDPAGQHAAIRARALARLRPQEARDLALWAAVRPPALLPVRGARVLADLARALAAIGEIEGARGAAKRGLKRLEGPGLDGVRLELLITLHAAAPEPRVVDSLVAVLQRILADLPLELRASLRQRPGLEAAWNRLDRSE
jgi:tetratricopeptide (TPR) repeat protein